MTTPEGPGRARQGLIYRAGALGQRPTVPTDFAELERRAASAMSPRAWAYVAGGAGQGATMRANLEAFERRRIVPRLLPGRARRDLSLDLFGRRLPAPVLLAPIGAAGLVRRDSDVAIGTAAAELGLPYIMSNQGCSPMEEVAAAMGGAPRWFQLYWSTDELLVDSLLARAAASGAEAVVVTLDTTMLGWRPQDLNLGSLPFSQGIGIAQYTSDPRFQEVVRDRITARSAPRDPVGTKGQAGDQAGDQPGHPAGRPAVHPAADQAGDAAESDVRVTLGALRSLLSISREHPGSLRTNLRSPTPRASVEVFLDIYSNPGLTWGGSQPCGSAPTFRSSSRESCTPTTRAGRWRSAPAEWWSATTADGRWTGRSPRSTRCQRCGRPSGLIRWWSWTAVSAPAATS